MIFPIRQTWRLSTEFFERRPYSVVKAKRWHPHGAWDCAAEVGTPILSPEDGELGTYYATRPRDGMYFRADTEHTDFYKAFRNYFYDTFGLIYILRGASGLTHIFSHSYFHSGLSIDEVVEEYPAQQARRPLTALLGSISEVKERNLIGEVGNAGWSTGPHLHYEIHSKPWEKWINRVDPKHIFKEEWEAHYEELRYNWKEEEAYFLDT